MNTEKTPLSRKDGIVIQDHNSEMLIYDLETSKAFSLNETSSLVWAACDGNNTVSEISRSISKKLNSPVNDELVWLALDQLKKENLISNSDEIIPDFNGMSRREVIRKVGLASVIALPIISSLVAPTAAMAQSACGSSCNNNGDCINAACSTCRQVMPGSGAKTCQA